MIDTFDATTHGFSLIAVRFERVRCRFGSGIVRPPCLKTRSVRGVIRPYRQTFVFWHIIAPAMPAPRLPAFRPAALRCSAGSVGRSLHPLRCFRWRPYLPPACLIGCKGYRPRWCGCTSWRAGTTRAQAAARCYLCRPPFGLRWWPRLLPARNAAFSAFSAPFRLLAGWHYHPKGKSRKIGRFCACGGVAVTTRAQ